MFKKTHGTLGVANYWVHLRSFGMDCRTLQNGFSDKMMDWKHCKWQIPWCTFQWVACKQSWLVNPSNYGIILPSVYVNHIEMVISGIWMSVSVISCGLLSGSWCRSRLLKDHIFDSVRLQVRANFSPSPSVADWKSEMESNLKSERNLKEIWKKSERNLKEIWSQKMISQSHEDTCRCPADPSRNLRGKMECGWMRGLLVDSGHIL